MLRRMFLGAVATAVVAAWSAVLAAQDRPPAVVTEPQDGATVAQVEDIDGRVNAAGWPVVVVKPLAGEEPWYCQRPIKDLAAGGVFSTRAHFGERNTPSGTKFRVAVLLLASKAAAHKEMPEGKTLPVLPAGTPKSPYVTVSRG